MPKTNIFDPSQYQDPEKNSNSQTEPVGNGVKWKTNTVVVDGTTLTVMFPEQEEE